MNKYFLLVWLSAGLLLGSCTRKAVPTTASTPATSENIVNPTRATNVDFRYLTAKGRAQVDQAGNKLPTINLALRARKDSVIWLSASVSALEVARVHITRDSVRVLNKLQREYYAGDFAYLSQRLNVPVTFEQVQAILLGDYLPAPAGTTPTVTTENEAQRVQFQQASLLIEQLINLSSTKVQQLSVRDQTNPNNYYSVDFSDFQPLVPGNQPFARTVSLRMQQAQNPASSATITYRSVELDKERLGFPFSVPANYARKK